MRLKRFQAVPEPIQVLLTRLQTAPEILPVVHNDMGSVPWVK